MSPNTLERDLVELLGRGAVSSDESDLRRYGGDALGTFRAFRASGRLNEHASAVVWPQNAAGISKCLAYASRHSVPVVPYGGGTGVMGASTPSDSSIILNLARMNRVIRVDKESRIATFQSGILLEDAHRALMAHDLRLGHDPWSRPIATLGGSHIHKRCGIHGLRARRHGRPGTGNARQCWGTARSLSRGPYLAHSSDLRLNHIFIGAEGTFGVVAEATVVGIPCTRIPDNALFRFP